MIFQTAHALAYVIPLPQLFPLNDEDLIFDLKSFEPAGELVVACPVSMRGQLLKTANGVHLDIL